ncbi:MAG: PTS sugar transporter subunit IIB [Thermaerobacter sp.]|nr:PTS sugar transporter subunit IIB [Thermaerobacter sp.]
MRPFKVLIVCGTGIATSTMVATKVREFLDKNGYAAVRVQQGKVMDLLGSFEADVIVATTQVPGTVKVPVINGIPLLTGMGAQQVFDELARLLPQP